MEGERARQLSRLDVGLADGWRDGFSNLIVVNAAM